MASNSFKNRLLGKIRETQFMTIRQENKFYSF